MKERKILSKEDVMRADDNSYSEIFIKEWDGYVRVHVISAKDRLEFEGEYTKKDGAINFEHKKAPLDLLSSALRTDNGAPMFDKNDLNILGEKNGRIINMLFQEALKINWMTREAEAQVKKK
jgi:hypothetical protein